MPNGICKLCLREGDLQESHFIPRGLYPKRGGMEYRTRHRAGLDETQLKQYLLCRSCEQRFNDSGESYVISKIAPKSRKSFPLHNTLRLACPRETGPGWSRFAGYDVGLDMAKFAYFTLSLVWRGAIAEWEMPGGDRTSRLLLGGFEEGFRQFLLGETTFPRDTWVLAFVHSDQTARDSFSLPPASSSFGFLSFTFLLRGMMLRACMGENVPEDLQESSCTSPRDCLFFGDGEKTILDAIRPLAPMPVKA
jgi:hypothetical protein